MGDRQSRIGLDPGRRERLINAVGNDAAELLYLFAAVSRHDLFQSISVAATVDAVDRFTGERLTLSDSQFHALCQIHLAEWLEKWRRLPAGHESPAEYGRIAGLLSGAAEADFVSECSDTWPEQIPVGSGAGNRSAA